MNINELKAGDWVMFDNCPVKIIDVHNTLSELTIFDNISLFDTEITEVEPMPLTEDILKNNGWKRQWNYIYTNKEFPYIELYYSDNKYKLTEMGVNIGNKFIKMISSVHELQHILWALGLNDELKVWII